MSRESSFLQPLTDHHTGRYTLANQRTGDVIVSDLEAALDSSSRRRGLLGRDGLPAGAGLVIAPCNSIHTFFMRFSIDAAFVDRDGRVVKLYESMPARRIGGAWQACAVVELPAGTVRRSGTRTGDLLQIAPL